MAETAWTLGYEDGWEDNSKLSTDDPNYIKGYEQGCEDRELMQLTGK